MILTLPMATAIKQAFPNAHITVMLREYTLPLVKMCPDVDETVVVDNEYSAFQLAKVMRRTNADIVFIPSPKTHLAFAALLSRIPTRVGTGYRWYSFCFNKKIFDHRKTAEHNEAEYNVRMLKAIGIASSTTPLPHLIVASPMQRPEPYAILHLLTGGSAPAWGVDEYIALAAWLTKQRELRIVLTGEKKDSEFLFTVAEKMKLAGANVHIQMQQTLEELATTLKAATLVVAGSTGPGHLAAALGTPTVGIFPLVMPLSKERWGFRGKRTENIAPERALKSECPACNDCTCISTVNGKLVQQAIERVLGYEYENRIQ